MRLYRFIDKDEKIDSVVVTDGSCEQKRVFITEIRGIVSPGNVNVTEDQKEGSDALLALGFPWKVGESVMHEDLIAFAEEKGLTLEITPQGLNELISVESEWEENECVLVIKTSIPAKKEVEIIFPDSVDLNESTSRYGKIRGDKKGLIAILKTKETSMTFTLDDLGLQNTEDLEIIVTSESGIQKFESIASIPQH